MRRVYVAQQRYDAYLVADLLKQAGIRAHVFNEHASSIVGDVPPEVAQPHVWIEREQDRERAEVVIARFREEGQRSPAGTRLCSHCGESSPGNFELCWSCGREL